MTLQSTTGSGCADTIGTRSVIRSLMLAGKLRAGCTYTVNDYSRGCLTAVTGIRILATSKTTFSQNAEITTSFDTTSWAGVYDIDSSRITQLRDNLGNDVGGAVGAEVDAFPWGNPLMLKNYIRDSLVYLDCDTTTLTVDRLTATGNAIVDLRGAEGIFKHTSVTDQARVYLSGATGLNIQGNSFSSRSRMYGNNATTVVILYTRMESEGLWQFTDQSDIRSYYCTFSSACRVYYYGGDLHWLYYSNFNSYGFVRQYDGSMKIYSTRVDSYGELRNQAGAGLWTITGGAYSGRAYVLNYNSADVKSQYDTVMSSGRVTFNGSVALTTSYNTISNLGALTTNGATVVYTCSITAQAGLTANGGSHYRSSYTTYAAITSSFNTNGLVVNGRVVQTLTAANTNRMRDYVNNTLL